MKAFEIILSAMQGKQWYTHLEIMLVIEWHKYGTIGEFTQALQRLESSNEIEKALHKIKGGFFWRYRKVSR